MITSTYRLNNIIEFTAEIRTLVNLSTKMEINIPAINANILLTLCKKPGVVLPHDQVMESVWGEKHRQVQYHTYYQALMTLRKALRSVGVDDEIIKTVPRKGIQLLCHVDDIENVGTHINLIETELSSTPKEIHEVSGFKKVMVHNAVVLFFFFCFTITCSWFAVDYINGINLINFFDSYHLVEITEQNSKIYFNNDASNFDYHYSFLKNNPDIRTKNSYIYVTAYSTTKQISALRCTFNPAAYHKNGNCITFFTHNYSSQ